MIKLCKIIFIILCVMFIPSVQSSVVMTGTRVIFPDGVREKVLQLSNKDEHPNLVQMWVDNGEAIPPKGSMTTPFIVTPQIFRMESLTGQVVRINYLGGNLPQDRESIFYLNFLQIPALKSSDQSQNKLVLIVNNKLKLFYRPKNLTGNIDKLDSEINVTLSDGKHISISNPTGYFINIRSAQIKVNGKYIDFAESSMVSPKSSLLIPLPVTVIPIHKGSELNLVLINDYGADVTSHYIL